MRVYSFIHIPKTGGTAVIEYLEKNHPNTFVCSRLSNKPYHSLMTKDTDNPICIIRDPYDRFLSAYYYWKYGPLNGPWVNRYKNHNNTNIELDDFIDKIQTNKKLLNTSITWQSHFMPQHNWIRSEDYYKTIIIKYQKDLTESIKKLLAYLNIPYNNIALSTLNTSKNKTNNITDKVKEYIDTHYEKDFDLINLINSRQNIFRFVI